MALVRVTLCVDKISFIKKGCYLLRKKSSFSCDENLQSEIRAKIA
jgi:hypothetical protein